MVLTIKKPARKLSLRKRFMALTAGERTRTNVLFDDFVKLTTRLVKNRCRLSVRVRKLGLAVCQSIILNIVETVKEPDLDILSVPDAKRTIESFSESECWNFFETRKADLPRLFVAFRIPEKVVLENGSTCPQINNLLFTAIPFIPD